MTVTGALSGPMIRSSAVTENGLVENAGVGSTLMVEHASAAVVEVAAGRVACGDGAAVDSTGALQAGRKRRMAKNWNNFGRMSILAA